MSYLNQFTPEGFEKAWRISTRQSKKIQRIPCRMPGWSLLAMRFDLALEEFKLYYEWDWKSAELAFQRVLQLNSDFPCGSYVLGDVYAVQGMYEEAIAVHQKAAAVSPAWGWGLGYAYALAGRRV